MTPRSGAWSVVPRDLRNGNIRLAGAIEAWRSCIRPSALPALDMAHGTVPWLARFLCAAPQGS
jgi:hypothetical protein